VFVKTYSAGTYVATTSADVSIVASLAAAISTTVSPALSTAVLNAGTDTDATADEAVNAVATSATTVHGTIAVTLKNASGLAVANDSVTATVTGAGVISFDGTNYGKSITYSALGGSATISVRADGTAGVGTIAVSTPGITFTPKTVTFFSKSPKTITAAVNNPVLKIGANAQALAVVATDSNGNPWTGQLYMIASSAAGVLIAGGSTTVPVACGTYDSTYKVHFCALTGKSVGTASYKIVDESLDTDADATTYAAADSAVTSNEVTVTVSNGVPSSVKVAFDKAHTLHSRRQQSWLLF